MKRIFLILVFISFVVYAEPALFNIARGPYLSMGTDSSMTVTFEAELSTSAKIIWGRAGEYPALADTMSESDYEIHHSFTLTGLDEDTEYGYKVITLDDESPDYYFFTAPELPRAFEFCAYGDNRNNDWVHDSICAMMLREEPRLLLNSGDVVDVVISPSDWQDFFDCIETIGASVPYWAAIGNHDTGFAFQLDFFEYPGNERYFSFDWSFVHFVCIHIYEDYSPGSEQYNFIYDDISSVPDSHFTIVFFHEPPYSSGNHGDNLLVQTNLVPLLDELDVDIAITGHDHSYEHLYLDDIHYIVTGGGGAPLYSVGTQDGTVYSESCYHYLRFHVERNLLCMQAVNLEGIVFDEFCISPLSIDEEAMPSQDFPFALKASPNPFRNYIDIKIESGQSIGSRLPIDPGAMELSITDINGRRIKSFDNFNGFTFYDGLSFRFRAENLNSGIFLVKLRYKSQVFTKKIIYTK